MDMNVRRSVDRSIVLNLFGAASLMVGNEHVSLSRKALALLYYLAVEGPTSRERMADLLWGHREAGGNLRVELHRVRATLAERGLTLFDHGSDPLMLGGAVTLDATPRTGLEMEGLDDISPQFQDWLDLQRLTSKREAGGHLRSRLLEELAAQVSPPFVVVLVGAPGAGRKEFAEALAVRLGLPFRSGDDPSADGVRYIKAEEAPVERALELARARRGVHVIGRSVFGEDPEFLLHLRAVMDPERMRFVTLKPLTWLEARGALAPGTHFSVGARLFLASRGNALYLRELLKLRHKVGDDLPLQVPLAVRAKFVLAARKLSAEARRLLELMSVRDYWGSADPLPVESGSEVALDELEGAGWVRWDGQGWRFTLDVARALILDTLPGGKRHRLKELARVGALRRPVGLAPSVVGREASELGKTVAVWATEPVWLDAPRLTGDAAAEHEGVIVLSRNGRASGTGRVTWELPQKPLLLRVSGNAVRGDDDPREEPLLRLRFGVSESSEAQLTDAPSGASGVVELLADGSRFDHFLLMSRADALTIEVAAAYLVCELTIEVWEYATGGSGVPATWRAEAVRISSESLQDQPLASA